MVLSVPFPGYCHATVKKKKNTPVLQCLGENRWSKFGCGACSRGDRDGMMVDGWERVEELLGFQTL